MFKWVFVWKESKIGKQSSNHEMQKEEAQLWELVEGVPTLPLVLQGMKLEKE